MLFTALTIGFAGSLHCLGMCSPLAFSVTNMKRSVLISRLLYNFGRIFTYGVLGAVVSLVGTTLSIFEFQNIISISLGISLLIIGFAGISRIKIPVITKVLQRFTTFLKLMFAKFLQRRSYASLLFLGAVNGLLPCGLTFLALGFCLALTSPVDGFTFMMLFGAGTLPAMIGLPSMISFLTARFPLNMHKVTTGLMIISGFLLIARVFITHPFHGEPEALIDIVLCR